MADLPVRFDASQMEPDETGLIFARVLDGAGGAHAVGWDVIKDWRGGDGKILWVHLDRTADGIEEWLGSDLGLSEPTVELLVSNDTRPRAFREGDALVTILRGINFNPGAEPEDMVTMQIWSDASRLVTLRRRRLQSPFDVLAMLEGGQGPRTAGELLAELVEHMVAKMNNSIISLNEQIDALEDGEDELEPAAMLDEITDIRRQCLALKRHMSPQHEALQQICRNPPEWMTKANCRDVHETIQRLRRYLDDLDVSKESALVLQDDLNNRATNQSNKTMYMLSIVAAIFLPLTFVTGLLGINVGGMPGVGAPDAFWITVGILVAMLAIQILIFRKMKWL